MSERDAKKKPSGSFYRKRKAIRASENRQQAKALKMFLETSSSSSQSQSESQSRNSQPQVSDEVELEVQKEKCDEIENTEMWEISELDDTDVEAVRHVSQEVCF